LKRIYAEAAVAIKRPSKSLGTPVRRPVTSLGLRHVDVRAAHQMAPGDLYLGWLCKNKSCGLVIAIALTQAESKPAQAQSDDQLAAIKCPQRTQVHRGKYWDVTLAGADSHRRLAAWKPVGASGATRPS
jgi:hypothetical protein